MLGHDADVGEPVSVAPGMRDKKWHTIGTEFRAPAKRINFGYRRVEFAIGLRLEKFPVAVLAIELILGKEKPILQRNIDRAGRAKRRRIIRVCARRIERNKFARFLLVTPGLIELARRARACRSRRS